MSPAYAWLEFALVGAAIGVAGYYLSLYGDVIAEKTGLSGAWIGFVLVAAVTSLPELVTGVSSVAVANVPDIALGDVLGSCVFNLTIIVVADFVQRGESVYTRASQGHVLSAGFGVILIGFVGFSILADTGAMPAIGHVGTYTPVIIMVYLLAVRTVFRYESRRSEAMAKEVAQRYVHLSLRAAAMRYALTAAVVLAAGTRMPYAAVDLATAMGWEQTFVGTAFVALATSLPEAAVTLSAVRLGALDMAIGNIFGSNLFNVFIVAVDDLFYLPAPLLSHVSPVHAVSAFSAVMMTGIAVVSLLYRPRARVFRMVGWGSLFLFSLFVLNLFVLYLYER
jgi:cation:H+ antiporter